jgi:hypothetical protein
LTYKVSSLTSFKITNKSNSSLNLEGNFKLHSQNNQWLSLFVNSTLNQSDKGMTLPSKFHLRYHHENNKIFALGFEDWDFVNKTSPDLLTGYGLYGRDLENGWRAFGGLNLGFSLNKSHVTFQKYLLGFKNKTFTGHLETAVNRLAKKDETKTDQPNWNTELNLMLDHKYNDNLKISEDLKYNIDTNKVSVQLGGEYRLDSSTVIKGKINQDFSKSFGIMHNFRNLLNIGFAVKVMFSY